MAKISAVRYHDFSMGHRVLGHEGKCRFLHGHNYRMHFTVEHVTRELDELGRVLDFSVIKKVLCEWIEDNWDHKMMLYEMDCAVSQLKAFEESEAYVVVPFNPTAENIAEYFLTAIAPRLLKSYGCKLTKVVLEETRKCSVECTLENPDA